MLEGVWLGELAAAVERNRSQFNPRPLLSRAGRNFPRTLALMTARQKVVWLNFWRRAQEQHACNVVVRELQVQPSLCEKL